jgi:hypothetical protein
MSVPILRGPATGDELVEMLEGHQSFIKLAVDVEERAVGGAGAQSTARPSGGTAHDGWGRGMVSTERFDLSRS